MGQLAKQLSAAFQAPLVAWGAVAAAVTAPDSSSSRSSGVATDWEVDGDNGRAFCFLPLPVSTGLPVHLNGFFELSSNRRDVWALGGGMAGVGAMRAEWNVGLIREVLAPAYLELLKMAAKQLGPGAEYDR